MAYINRNFPTTSTTNRFTDPLQSPGFRTIDKDGIEEVYSGTLTYLQFVNLVKMLWEQSHPTIPIIPLGPGTDTFAYHDYAIVYALELRKSHTVEPKPRMRQNVLSNSYTIYGQKFQNIISFSVMTKIGVVDGGSTPSSLNDDTFKSQISDQIIEAFEDFMLEYTPVLKAAGATELVYSRRLSDSEINREEKDILKKTVTYMLTTEKTFAAKNDRIEKILIDVRTWMAYEPSIVNAPATPDFENIDINIVDLNQTATPNI